MIPTRSPRGWRHWKITWWIGSAVRWAQNRLNHGRGPITVIPVNDARYGDLLLLYIDTDHPIEIPGWMLQSHRAGVQTSYQVMRGPLDPVDLAHHYVIHAYRGVDPAAPIDDEGSSAPAPTLVVEVDAVSWYQIANPEPPTEEPKP